MTWHAHLDEAMIVYRLLLSSVATISIFEKHFMKLLAQKESFRKPTSLCATGRVTRTLRKRVCLPTVHVQNHMPPTFADCAKFVSSLCKQAKA